MNQKNNSIIISDEMNNETKEEINNKTKEGMTVADIPTSLAATKPENTPPSSKKSAKKTKPPNPVHFNYIEYFTTIKGIIHEYKLTELREVVKYIKIKGVKTKQDCITKIDEYFVKYVNAIKIQRIYRGFLVRHFFLVKGGKGVYNIINKCVNETDFYTLEPLLEIPTKSLFIVKEISPTIKKQPVQPIEGGGNGGGNNKGGINGEEGDNVGEGGGNKEDMVNGGTNIKPVEPTFFYYGFNISSLITLYKKNGTIKNPYNRTNFTIETVQNIFKHYQIQSILFKETLTSDNIIDNIIPFKSPSNAQINRLFTPPTPSTHATSYTTTTTTARSLRSRTFDDTARPTEDSLNNVYVSIFPTSTNTQELDAVRTSITIFKQQPMNVRINELFMYIDQLGNYTNSTWFLQLNKRKYYIFYSQLRELWSFRAQIPVFIKNSICPLGDPFTTSSSVFRKPYDQITEEEVCIGCLDVIENIIMTSLDVEYRKIGCLHVLTALTYVSPEARSQYGFLVD